MKTTELDLELAAEQISDYLYPNNGWIGTFWIQDNVLLELAKNLKRAVDKNRKQRKQNK